ncbi:nucleotidyltransferase domain-containing protein [Candidatus Poribacteria bacterium]|nr:nucleotidyltransferase domain-containing protein [Candidatus Poribacteria bacterium]
MSNPLERAIEIIIKVADPDQIILFGSRARGNARPNSDYDICVLKSGMAHRRKLTQQIYRSLLGVGVPVEVIVETPERFDALKDNPFLIYREIARYGSVIYEKREYR